MLGISPFFCAMREEILWPGGPVLETHPGVFPLGTDAVLLADFCNAPRRGAVCDLGCGTGFLLVRLLWENPGLSGLGAELSAAGAENARRNLRRNGLACRGAVREGDLRLLEEREAFDLAVSNPPYFPNSAPGESMARKESCLTFPELCRTAARILKHGGRFCLVHRAERLAELCGTMEDFGLAPSRLRYVRHRQGAAPKLVLLEGIKGGGQNRITLPDLILRDAAGNDTPETRRIYRMEETK